MSAPDFDHIAIGAARREDAVPTVVGVLGGEPHSGGPGDGFRWACWRFAGGGRLEVIEPWAATGSSAASWRAAARGSTT